MYSEACLNLRERSAETIVGPAQGVLGTVGDAMPTGHCVCMRVGTTPLWGASADLTTVFAVAGERRDALWLRGRPAPMTSTLPDSQLDDPMTPAEPDEASRRGSAEPAVDDLIASRRRARAERAERDASAAWSGLGRCAVAAGAALTPRAVDGSGARSGQRVRPPPRVSAKATAFGHLLLRGSSAAGRWRCRRGWPPGTRRTALGSADSADRGRCHGQQTHCAQRQRCRCARVRVDAERNAAARCDQRHAGHGAPSHQRRLNLTHGRSRARICHESKSTSRRARPCRSR